MKICLKVSSPSVNKEQGGPLQKCGSYGGRVQLLDMCCGAQNALNRVSENLNTRFRNCERILSYMAHNCVDEELHLISGSFCGQIPR